MNKKIFYIIFAIIFVTVITTPVLYATTDSYATSNSISSISIDIQIDELGNATFTEVWNVAMYDGTEMYRPYQINTSNISNLTVTDESGTTYDTISSWNINDSRENKKYKCGINTTSDGFEICWGIGEYGIHTYTITYQISNFVTNSTNSQLVYLKLISANMDPIPDTVDITISASFDLTDYIDNVSCIGFSGITNTENGKITVNTTSKLSSTEYITLKIEFKDGTFDIVTNTDGNDTTIENTTDDIDTVQEENTTKDSSNTLKIIEYVIITVIAVLILGFAILVYKRKKEIKEENIP